MRFDERNNEINLELEYALVEHGFASWAMNLQNDERHDMAKGHK